MYSGKALYQPSGKAGEYGQWAVNFYNGCSNGCTYCYLNKGIYSNVMGRRTPTLKECLRNTDLKDGFAEDIVTRVLKNPEEVRAHLVAIKEILAHKKDIIRDGGLFFSFSTDPCLDETINLTLLTALYCMNHGIPVIILTKRADWVYSRNTLIRTTVETAKNRSNLLAVGFTLTGHDDMEPGASSNEERLRAMKYLHKNRIITWASIEPVVDYPSSLEMIRSSVQFCDHYKVGLMSGAPKGTYTLDDTVSFINNVQRLLMDTSKTVYWKNTIREVIGGGSPVGYNFVEANWNMFNNTTKA